MEVARRHIYLTSTSSNTSSTRYTSSFSANHIAASSAERRENHSAYQKSQQEQYQRSQQEQYQRSQQEQYQRSQQEQYQRSQQEQQQRSQIEQRSQQEQQEKYRSLENGSVASLDKRRASGSMASIQNSRRASDRNTSINSLNRQQRDTTNTSQTSLQRQRRSSNTSLTSLNRQRRNTSNNASVASLNRQKGDDQAPLMNGTGSNNLRNRSRTNSSHSSLSDNAAASRNQKSRASTNSRTSERTPSGRQSKASQRKEKPNVTSSPEPSNEAVVEEERFNRDGSKSIMRRKVTATTNHTNHALDEDELTAVEVHISPATETRLSPVGTPVHRGRDYDGNYKDEEQYRRDEDSYAREDREEKYEEEEREEMYAQEQRDEFYEEENMDAQMYEEENREDYYSSMMNAEEYTEEELRYMEEQRQFEENERLKREGIDHGMTRSDWDDGPGGPRNPRFRYPPRFGGKRPSDDYPDDRFPYDGLPDDGLPTDGFPDDMLPTDGLPRGDFPDDQLPMDDFPHDGLPNGDYPNGGLPNDGLPTGPDGFDFDDMLAMEDRGPNYNHDYNRDDLDNKKMEFNARNKKNVEETNKNAKGVSLATLEKQSHQTNISMSDLSLYLKSDDQVLKANTAAYIMHMAFTEKEFKSEIRQYDIIQLLVELMSHEDIDCHRNAAGALKNLSYGNHVEENKMEIYKANGVKACASLLYKTSWIEVREHVTGVLFNMSSVRTLKQSILIEAMEAVAILIIIPLSGWDKAHANAGRKPGPISWSLLLSHSTGILRNVSSDGLEARKTLRAIDGLVDSLIWIMRAAISSENRSDINIKIIENVVCSLRNLSYRVDIEVDRNIYLDAMKVSTKEDSESKSYSPSKDSMSDNSNEPLVMNSDKKKKKNFGGTGCLGMKKKPFTKSSKTFNNPLSNSSNKKPPAEHYKYLIPVRDQSPKPFGVELLWQPETVTFYIYLLTNSTNPITLEAGAGAIHNLCGCKWNWSALLRVHVRLQKGIPPMQDLLSVDQEYVVRSIAYTLRNLAIDKTNKWSIGKYAHKSLTQVLPRSDALADDDKPDEHTISAVLSALQVVVYKDMHNSRYIKEDGGISKLVALTRASSSKEHRTYSKKVVTDANRVLLYMYDFKECRESMKNESWSHSKAEETEKTFKSSSLKKSSRMTADIFAYVDDDEKEELLGLKNRQMFLNLDENNDGFSNSDHGDSIEMTPMVAKTNGVRTRERADSFV